MKKTILIALITTTIISTTQAETHILSIENNSNNSVQIALESLETKKIFNFQLFPGEKSGTVKSPENSTVSINLPLVKATLLNQQATVIKIMPDNVIKFGN